MPKVLELWSIGDVPKLGRLAPQNDKPVFALIEAKQTGDSLMLLATDPATSFITPASPGSPSVTLEHVLAIPSCQRLSSSQHNGISPSYRNGNSKYRSNLQVLHRLKFVLRVEKEDNEGGASAKKKRYDVPLALDLNILSVSS
jgi:hypothetical protein